MKLARFVRAAGVIAAMLACAHGASAEPGRHLVTKIVRDGRDVNSVDTGVVREPAGHTRQTGLAVNDVVLDGTTITTDDHVSVVLVSGDGWSAETIAHNSRVRFDRTSSDHDTTVLSGAVVSSVRHHSSSFYYHVRYKTFIGAAQGTEFTTTVSPTEIAFTCSEGKVDVERSGTIYLESERREITGVKEVTVIDPVQQRVARFPLTLEQYLRRFQSLDGKLGSGGARAYYEEQLRAAGDDPFRRDAALDALARLLDQDGAYRAAHDAATQRLDVARTLPGGETNTSVADAYTRLAEIDGHLGEPLRALDEARTSVSKWNDADAAGDQINHAWAENALGDALFALGEVEKSRLAYERALAMFEKLEEPGGGSGTLAALANIERIQRDYERHDLEIESARRVVAIAERLTRLNGTETPRTAQAYQDAANAFSHVGDQASRQLFAKRAYDAWLKVFGNERHVEVAAEYFEIASVRERVQLAEHAMAVFAQTEPAMNERAYDLFVKVADVYQSSYRFDLAHQALRKAQIVAEHLRSEGNPTPIERLQTEYANLAYAEGDVPGELAFARKRVQLAEEAPGRPLWPLAEAYDGLAGADESALDLTSAVRDRRAAAKYYDDAAAGALGVSLNGAAHVAVELSRLHDPSAASEIARLDREADRAELSPFQAALIVTYLATAAEFAGDAVLALRLREHALALDRKERPPNVGDLQADAIAGALDAWPTDRVRAKALVDEAQATFDPHATPPAWIDRYFSDVLRKMDVPTSAIDVLRSPNVVPSVAIRRRRHSDGNDVGSFQSYHLGPGANSDWLAYEASLKVDRYLLGVERTQGAPPIDIARRERFIAVDEFGVRHNSDAWADIAHAADELDRLPPQDASALAEYAFLIDCAVASENPAQANRAGLAMLIDRARARIAGAPTGAAVVELLVSITGAERGRDPSRARTDLGAASASAATIADPEVGEIVAQGYDDLAQVDLAGQDRQMAVADLAAACTLREAERPKAANPANVTQTLAIDYAALAQSEILSGAAAAARTHAERGAALAPSRLENALRVAEAHLFGGDVPGALKLYDVHLAGPSRASFAGEARAALERYRRAGLDASLITTAENHISR